MIFDFPYIFRCLNVIRSLNVYKNTNFINFSLYTYSGIVWTMVPWFSLIISKIHNNTRTTLRYVFLIFQWQDGAQSRCTQEMHYISFDKYTQIVQLANVAILSSFLLPVILCRNHFVFPYHLNVYFTPFLSDHIERISSEFDYVAMSNSFILLHRIITTNI